MDAFFASVEVRDNPSLKGKPVLVGYPGKRGVVAAASYEARKFGCHSAQVMSVALRKCPQAVVIEPNHDRYVEVSHAAFEIFGRFTPLVEGLSIDEAFLDLTGTERLHGSPRVLAEALRAAVRRELEVTCSVGLAGNKFVAKIASERNKPDGLTEVVPGTERAFLEPLPVRALWGVGPRTEEVLARYIVAPNRIDARRCISYLTIELQGSIPEEFRDAIGNRIFGCDDCQLVCPWNKFAKRFDEPDFRARNGLDQATLAELFAWTEAEFLQRTEGSAIRRTGYEGWLRNIAVALGNAPPAAGVFAALASRREDASAVVREHVAWALAKQARSGAVG